MKSVQLTVKNLNLSHLFVVVVDVLWGYSSAVAPWEKNSAPEWDDDVVQVRLHCGHNHVPNVSVHPLIPPPPLLQQSPLHFAHRVNDHTSELILNNNFFHKAQWREHLHHLCTHTVDAVCTDSMHTAAYTQIQTYWSTITHMHACAPETWQLGFRETYKHLISMTGEVGGCIWDGGETNWLERCFLPSKCVMSPQQVHTTCGESRKETKVCLRGWSQLCALQSSFAVCVVYECMNLRR